MHRRSGAVPLFTRQLLLVVNAAHDRLGGNWRNRLVVLLTCNCQMRVQARRCWPFKVPRRVGLWNAHPMVFPERADGVLSVFPVLRWRGFPVWSVAMGIREKMAGANVRLGRSPASMERPRRAGAAPCGLGARDTLRTRMGYPLYGHELTETTPLEAEV